MNRITIAFRIVDLLSQYGKMSCKELANRIGASERKIRRCIVDLYEADIYIDSVRGRYGGYVLRQSSINL